MTKEQTSVERIDKLIVEVRATRDSFNEKVHEAAYAIIVHANTYGDCSRAKMLARAVPSRLRNMLTGYFMLYSPIGVTIGTTAADDKSRFIKEENLIGWRKRSRVTGAIKVVAGRETLGWGMFDLDRAKANKWYDDPARMAPEPKPLDTLSTAWQKLDKFLQKLIDDAKADDDKAKYIPEDRQALLKMAQDIKLMVDRYHIRQLKAMNENPDEDEGGAGEQGATGDNVVAGPRPRRTPAKPRQTATKARKAASVH